MSYELIHASDYQTWERLGLDKILNKYEMQFCEQEPDHNDCYRGKWYVCDDQSLTVIFGTFGNYNSPGASSCTFASIYSDRACYKRAVEEWERKEEFLDCDDYQEEEQ